MVQYIKILMWVEAFPLEDKWFSRICAGLACLAVIVIIKAIEENGKEETSK
jgi:hypothetical protein